jgi:hypothetical protein
MDDVCPGRAALFQNGHEAQGIVSEEGTATHVAARPLRRTTETKRVNLEASARRLSSRSPIPASLCRISHDIQGEEVCEFHGPIAILNPSYAGNRPRVLTRFQSAMPYQIQSKGQILRVTFSGHVTKDEFVDSGRELLSLRATLERQPDQLTDLSSIEKQDTDYALVQPVSRELREQVFSNTFRFAMVAPTPFSFGLARMFQSLVEHPQIHMRVFKSKDEAEKWLAREPSEKHDKDMAP